MMKDRFGGLYSSLRASDIAKVDQISQEYSLDRSEDMPKGYDSVYAMPFPVLLRYIDALIEELRFVEEDLRETYKYEVTGEWPTDLSSDKVTEKFAEDYRDLKVNLIHLQTVKQKLRGRN